MDKPSKIAFPKRSLGNLTVRVASKCSSGCSIPLCLRRGVSLYTSGCVDGNVDSTRVGARNFQRVHFGWLMEGPPPRVEGPPVSRASNVDSAARARRSWRSSIASERRPRMSRASNVEGLECRGSGYLTSNVEGLAAVEREGNNFKGVKKPRPESGLDCLICAILAGQRS